ncbi:hypothetical protein TNCV_2376071 [Trichonephila clavipes]|nr:hypothetical protein TNCV_2376071 [Trichonephila clavipes]
MPAEAIRAHSEQLSELKRYRIIELKKRQLIKLFLISQIAISLSNRAYMGYEGRRLHLLRNVDKPGPTIEANFGKKYRRRPSGYFLSLYVTSCGSLASRLEIVRSSHVQMDTRSPGVSFCRSWCPNVIRGSKREEVCFQNSSLQDRLASVLLPGMMEEYNVPSGHPVHLVHQI